MLRRFISELSENQALLAEEEMRDLENKSLDYDDDFEEDYDSDNFDGDIQWKRLRIIEDCEVNGVRFPAGIQIDVKLIDAERLLEAGQAEIIEKPVDPEEDAEETEESEEAEEIEETETEESEEVEETEDNEGEDYDETTEEDDDPSVSDEDTDVSEDDEDS